MIPRFLGANFKKVALTIWNLIWQKRWCYGYNYLNPFSIDMF